MPSPMPAALARVDGGSCWERREYLARRRLGLRLSVLTCLDGDRGYMWLVVISGVLFDIRVDTLEGHSLLALTSVHDGTSPPRRFRRE